MDNLTTGAKQLEIGGMPCGGGSWGMSGGGFGLGLLFGILFGGFRGHGGFAGGCCGDGFTKLDSIEQQIQTQSFTDQINLIQANLNAGQRDTALGFAGVQKSICETDSKIDMQTLILSKQVCEDGEKTRALITSNRMADLENALEKANLRAELSERGLNQVVGGISGVNRATAHFDHEDKQTQAQINIMRNDINAIGSTIANIPTMIASALANQK